MRTGRPHKLPPVDEHEMYLMRKTGISIRTCASFFRVSVPTANRVLARQAERFDPVIEPLARELRARLSLARD